MANGGKSAVATFAGSVLEALGVSRATAAEKVRELAAREAEGKATQRDVEALGKLLAEANLRDEDYQRILNVHRQRVALELERESLKDAGRRMAEARDRLQEFEVEACRVRRELAEKGAGLEAAIGEQVARANRAEEIEVEIGEDEYIHAAEMGIELPDLDRCRLRSRDGTFNDDICPSKCRTVIVPVDVYRREHARRVDLRRAGYKLVQVEFQPALDAWRRDRDRWAASAVRDRNGMLVGVPPEGPKPPEVTWDYVLERLPACEAVMRGEAIESLVIPGGPR